MPPTNETVKKSSSGVKKSARGSKLAKSSSQGKKLASWNVPNKDSKENPV